VTLTFVEQAGQAARRNRLNSQSRLRGLGESPSRSKEPWNHPNGPLTGRRRARDFRHGVISLLDI
jgi:hypothetical protein